jgi:hypothetical protein
MRDKKMFLITGLLLLSMFSWLGCGEGTLEVDLDKSQGGNITKAEVRVDGKVYGPFEITGENKIPPLELGAGGHVVGVDFLDSEGKVVSSYGPKIFEIQAGQTERISISEGTPPGIKPAVPVERIRIETSRFEIKEFFELTPTSPDKKTLILSKTKKGAASIEGVTIAIREDNYGNLIEQFTISAEFRFDDGLLELIEPQIEPQKWVYKGNASGRWTAYRGRKEDGDIIFDKGTWVTSPKDKWHLVMSPDNQMIEFTNQVMIEGVGKGKFQGLFLKGKVDSEIKGDVFLISMESELFSEP